jgi:hypothetical protein
LLKVALNTITLTPNPWILKIFPWDAKWDCLLLYSRWSMEVLWTFDLVTKSTPNWNNYILCCTLNTNKKNHWIV